MRSFTLAILTSISLYFSASSAHADGRIMITSYTNNFEFASGNVGCPKGVWGNAFVVDLNRLGDRMDDRDYEELFRLIGVYERKHGIEIRSKTRVQDMRVIEDRIRTEATGPVDETGIEMCELIAKYI